MLASMALSSLAADDLGQRLVVEQVSTAGRGVGERNARYQNCVRRKGQSRQQVGTGASTAGRAVLAGGAGRESRGPRVLLRPARRRAKSCDGLYVLARQALHTDPMSGRRIVFTNRRARFLRDRRQARGGQIDCTALTPMLEGIEAYRHFKRYRLHPAGQRA